MKLRHLAAFGVLLQIAPSAFAQDTAAPPQTRAAGEEGEIVVTAQRRAENITDVPISINVVGSDTLERSGIASVSGLQSVVPGLRFDLAGPYSQPTIRGVGNALSGPGLSANVATYVDGFYQANPLSTDSDLVDIDSIQVLKGPQGTLFGRNATGGAIVINTRVPDDQLRVIAKASYGRFDEFRSSFYISGGLAPDLAASLALNYRHDGGFVENILTGRKDDKSDRFTGRLKLAYSPSDTVRLTLIGEAAEVDDPYSFALAALDGQSTGRLFPGTIVATERGETSNDLPGKHRLHSQALYFKGEFDLGGVDLTSYTGARRDRARENYDIDSSSASVLGALWSQKDDTFSQEVILASKPGGALTWVVGGFYFHGRSIIPDFSIVSGGSPPARFFYSRVDTDSYALFADGTLNFAPQLYLTLGGRLSHDSLRLRFATAPSFTEDGARDKRTAFKPRAVLRYEPVPEASVYVSVSQGSKSAIFNANGQDKVPVRPEDITAYEIGAKYGARGVNLSAAVFRYDYEDLQIASYIGTGTRILNAADARIYGAEINAGFPLAPGLRLDVGGAYTDAKYRRFPNAPRYTFDPAAGVVIAPADASGNRMGRSPRFSGNASLNYETAFAGGTLQLNGNVSYRSDVFFDSFEERRQNGYALVDARAAWTDPSDRWTLAVYGRNITDHNYVASVIENAVAISALYGRPATYGVEVGFKF